MDTTKRDGPGAPQAMHCLRFDSLFSAGKAVAVPCDACGHVDLDALSERLRNAYFGARALVGKDYAYPVVEHLH